MERDNLVYITLILLSRIPNHTISAAISPLKSSWIGAFIPRIKVRSTKSLVLAHSLSKTSSPDSNNQPLKGNTCYSIQSGQANVSLLFVKS